MLCEFLKKSSIQLFTASVLILVLMEDALRDKQLQWSCNCESVLILVLMEDALREQKNMIEEVSKLS